MSRRSGGSIYRSPATMPGKRATCPDPANSGRSGPSRRCWQREPRARLFRLGVHSGHFLAVTPIAVLPIMGTLVSRGMGLRPASGMTGYQEVGAAFGQAMADPDVLGHAGGR